MRTLFLAVLLANLMLGAWGYWQQTQPPPNAAYLQQQILPERIRLITTEEAERMAAPRKPTAPSVCIEWGAFAAADVPKAIEAIEALGVKTQERRQEDAARWWVMLPPLANRAAANTRIAELKKAGIEDVGLIDDDAGGFRNGISLGLFRSEDGARTRVDMLAKRGVAGVRIVPREQTLRVYLQVRDAPEGFRGRAAELKSGWPSADLRDCPGEAKG
jgi:SPOR domain